MAYITRDANYVLLFLIVIAIIIIVGVTIFYKKNFEELNEEYTLKLDELNRISEELAQKQSLLNETQLELGLKAKREEDFTTKYTEIKGEKDVLEGEKATLEGQKADLEDELLDRESELRGAKSDIQDLEVEKAAITTERNQFKVERDHYYSEWGECEDEVDEYEDLYGPLP
jgi:chromosome segregation ATPase